MKKFERLKRRKCSMNNTFKPCDAGGPANHLHLGGKMPKETALPSIVFTWSGRDGPGSGSWESFIISAMPGRTGKRSS